LKRRDVWLAEVLTGHRVCELECYLDVIIITHNTWASADKLL